MIYLAAKSPRHVKNYSKQQEQTCMHPPQLILLRLISRNQMSKVYLLFYVNILCQSLNCNSKFSKYCTGDLDVSLLGKQTSFQSLFRKKLKLTFLNCFMEMFSFRMKHRMTSVAKL